MITLLRFFALLPLPLAHLFGWLIGLLFFFLPNHHRRVSRINIALCFKEKSQIWRSWLLLRSLVETGKTIMESPILWFSERKDLLKIVAHEFGSDVIKEALSHQKGVVIIVPHLGSWELVSLYCSTLHPTTSLYRPLRHGDLEDMVVKGRKHLGAKLAQTNANGVRALSRALRNNEFIAIPPDQDPRDNGGLFIPFFGIETNTITLASRLALKSGANLVVCIAERLAWGRGFAIHFQALDLTNISEIKAHVTAINQHVEASVRRMPQQYQWSYKRFRTRPEGDAEIY